VLGAKAEILKKANDQDPVLNSFGGGAKDLEAKVVQTKNGDMLITELFVDCRDAMGANAVNTMAEAVAPIIEALTGARSSKDYHKPRRKAASSCMVHSIKKNPLAEKTWSMAS